MLSGTSRCACSDWRRGAKVPEPTGDADKALRLLVGGPALCGVCGRTFQRGGAFDVPELLRSPSVCQWCLAGWLEEITGWQIINQMRGWLVTRDHFKRDTWTEARTLSSYEHDMMCEDTD